jgi:hypothetical protein
MSTRRHGPVTTPFGSRSPALSTGTGRTLGDQGALVLRLTRATVNVPTGTRRGLETTGISDKNGCKTGVIVASLADNVCDVWGLRKAKVSRSG